MIIRRGTESDKRTILEQYPYTAEVIGEGGFLFVAAEEEKTLGFLWSFIRDIPADIGKTECFINVIEVFDDSYRRKGIGSLLVQKCIAYSKEKGCYQVRAYCEIGNRPSNMLWVKNGFTISPVKNPDGSIFGSYAARIL